MTQADNSNFLQVKPSAQGPVAIIEMENGTSKRKKVAFDLLGLNRTIQNIQKNLEKAKSKSTQEFHEAELNTFQTALTNLREMKKVL